MSKKGVLLLNLGSPDSTETADVKRYLHEFLMDGRVLDSSEWIRKIVVNCFILPTRPAKSAEAYKKVWTDKGSPLIVTSEAVTTLVDQKTDCSIYLAMRYGNPSTPDVLKQIQKDGITDLYIMPLYPHYAMSSYETAVVYTMDTIKELGMNVKTKLLQPFYKDPQYVDALVEVSKAYLEKDYDLLLFSFHGIPERHLTVSDPSHAHCMSREDCCETCHPAHATCYRHQCLETMKAFVEKANIPENKFAYSFQSRLGREPWLKPYTDQELERYAKEGVKNMLVICPVFVSDCLETLEEIAMEGKESFIESGGDSLEQIPCLNEHPAWINFLTNNIQNWIQE